MNTLEKEQSESQRTYEEGMRDDLVTAQGQEVVLETY